MEEAQELCKRVSFLRSGQVIKTGRPAEIVGEIGAFCVEQDGETQLFTTREGAIEYLSTCPSSAKLRETNLEDVFFRLAKEGR